MGEAVCTKKGFSSNRTFSRVNRGKMANSKNHLKSKDVVVESCFFLLNIDNHFLKRHALGKKILKKIKWEKNISF